MRRVVLNEFLTLDGVAQAPGGAEEDPSGGFAHGGWHMPYMEDQGALDWVLAGIRSAEGYLLGRVTYEIFAAYWPSAPAEEQVVAEPLNSRPKYVVSTTLREPLAWSGSTLVGDVPEGVAALKREGDGDLSVIGSTRLATSLIAHGLVDEYRLMIDPVMVGAGKRLGPNGAAPARLRLVDSRASGTGALLATYVPAEA